ncbi:MAG: hypothetical protein CO128_08595 [Ignavibacteriales bacterium CG_4_9_14_3_um_filter_30_11]|nr:MAG: hypothetical protein CO128_08595 [Ignavibacteriales bacterium CG_4_9_14_3_um_filter_30_11]
MKNISPQDLLVAIEKKSGKIFTEQEGLLQLFNIGLSNENGPLFEKLIFTSKYILGLKRVLEKGAVIPDVNNLDEIKKDLSENLTSVKNILNEFSIKMTDNYRSTFESNYLAMTQNSLAKLYLLLEGLEWTKMYLNDLKRNLI